jgi:hypothetical protein
MSFARNISKQLIILYKSVLFCDSHDIAVKLLKVTINNKNPALNQVLRLDEFGATVQSPH